VDRLTSKRIYWKGKRTCRSISYICGMAYAWTIQTNSDWNIHVCWATSMYIYDVA